jgi:hypothetical protein
MKTTRTTQSITALPESPTRDRHHRLSRYIWQMAVRVFLFVGAVLVYTVWHNPLLAIIPIVLAGVIPWIAVVIANAGSHVESDAIAPAGALVRAADYDPALRQQQEDARAQAYRDEQERLRQAAQHAQEQWQRNGDRSRVWGHR